MHSELARTTQIAARPVAPAPQDMLWVTNPDIQDFGSDKQRRVRTEDKAAQRGPLVASAYLTAALTKASVSSTDGVGEAWVQPGEGL